MCVMNAWIVMKVHVYSGCMGCMGTGPMVCIQVCVCNEYLNCDDVWYGMHGLE